MLQPCSCRNSEAAYHANREARVASLNNRLVGYNAAVGSFKPLTPAENLELLKASLGPARSRYFTRRHAVSLAVRSAREGLPDDLDALAVLFADWQSARYELEATEAQIAQAEKEAKSNG